MQTMPDVEYFTRRGIMCAHLEPAYQIEPWSGGCETGNCDSYGALVPSGTLRERYRLRESELAQEQSILLPLFHQMAEEEARLCQ